MKTSATKPLLLSCLGIAIGTILPSCVDPYAQSYGTQERVTTYRTGYEVRSLPPGYRTETIGGTRYYNHNGTYYRSQSGRYIVVEAPRQDYQSPRPRYDDSYSQDRDPRYGRPDLHREVIITRLPSGYREINHNGGRYYQVNDTYYQQRGSGYIVVTSPY